MESSRYIYGALLLTVVLWPGCNDNLYSPFFERDELTGIEQPRAYLEILAAEAGEHGCMIEADVVDSLVTVEVNVGGVSPEWLSERYVAAELEVSVGHTYTGLVIADTAGIDINGPGLMELVLPVENGGALQPGENPVTVIAITRYLDPGGKLALPQGRDLRRCTLQWQ